MVVSRGYPTSPFTRSVEPVRRPYHFRYGYLSFKRDADRPNDAFKSVLD